MTFTPELLHTVEPMNSVLALKVLLLHTVEPMNSVLALKDSHHVACAGEVVVEQALQGHPAHGPVLVVPQTVVVHGEQVSGQGIVCDLHLHAVINTEETQNITFVTHMCRK